MPGRSRDRSLRSNDVGVLSFGLQHGDGGDHGGDVDDVGQGVRLQVLHDLFDGCGEGVALDEGHCLTFGGVVAAEQLEAAGDEGFDAGVLVDPGAVVGVGRAGGIFLREEDVAGGWLFGLGVVDLEPLAHVVLGPHGVVEVDGVGGAVHGGDDLDLVCGDAVAEVEAVHGVLDDAEEAAVVDGVDVVHLLAAALELEDLVEFGKLPVVLLVDEVGVGGGEGAGDG
jgi:hypothetical protein